MKNSEVLLASGLFLSFIANIYLLKVIRDSASETPYARNDQLIIRKSINKYAESTGQTETEAMRDRFPVVARGADDRCVNLRLSRGGAGLTPIYCYDDNGYLIYQSAQ